ncbi:deoxyribose-phosphate aldolase [Natranaeroarchaeum sulfidigenes]|uniref:Deoxyribose-phosphate aldolase n=1 Tax=Natranaeroarchaeum sulfidigenes TaxID=2784880 RepID=A0A897MPH2_9EURY|nr:deoxyribose-phosphate aldolase [Natranaeroarchaeum sulfidigenes]QSG02312.1 Deoxyribose-phosphate aldolase [Natranaeroarchaeum sulfidigenes]
MEYPEFPARIDHTVLGPETTSSDVYQVLDEAQEYGMNACIPHCYVAEAVEYAPPVRLVTVVGFPHGQTATETKVRAATSAVASGADEIDVVANIGRFKHGEEEAVLDELHEIVAAVSEPVKVIIETALLTDEERDRLSELAVEADADYLKTSTGFASGGATIPDVEAMSEYLPVKASGGIGSYETALEFVDAGAERIGASNGEKIAAEYRESAGQ